MRRHVYWPAVGVAAGGAADGGLLAVSGYGYEGFAHWRLTPGGDTDGTCSGVEDNPSAPLAVRLPEGWNWPSNDPYFAVSDRTDRLSEAAAALATRDLLVHSRGVCPDASAVSCSSFRAGTTGDDREDVFTFRAASGTPFAEAHLQHDMAEAYLRIPDPAEPAHYGASLAADPPPDAPSPLPEVNPSLHFYSGPLTAGTTYELRAGNFDRGGAYRLEFTLWGDRNACTATFRQTGDD